MISKTLQARSLPRTWRGYKLGVYPALRFMCGAFLFLWLAKGVDFTLYIFNELFESRDTLSSSQ